MKPSRAALGPAPAGLGAGEARVRVQARVRLRAKGEEAAVQLSGVRRQAEGCRLQAAGPVQVQLSGSARAICCWKLFVLLLAFACDRPANGLSPFQFASLLPFAPPRPRHAVACTPT